MVSDFSLFSAVGQFGITLRVYNRGAPDRSLPCLICRPRRRRCPLVSTNPRRPALPGYGNWRVSYQSGRSQPDHAGRGRPWLFWRPAADRAFLRGSLGHRLRHGAADPEVVIPGRGSPPAVRTIDDRSDSCDRLLDGRVLISVLAGGDPVEMHGDGVWFGHSQHYKATAERLTVWRPLMQGQTVHLNEDHLRGRRQKPLPV
jgi:hypothetical protein